MKRLRTNDSPARHGRGRVVAVLAGVSTLVAGCASGPLIPPEAIPGAGSVAGTYTPQATAPYQQPAGLPPASRTPVTSAPLLAPAPAAQRRHHSINSSPVHQGPPRRHKPRRAKRFPADVAAPAPAVSARRETAPASAQPQTAATIRFTPVIGAPVSAIEPLSSELEQAARRKGIVIRNTADKPVDGILRGYFSASNKDGHTTVVYVWDVLDDNGNRLYRINGKETAPAAATGDVWASVPDAMMKEIARKTIRAYSEWRAGHG